MSYTYNSSTSTFTWYPGVQKYSSDGTLISQFGAQGNGDGQFGGSAPGGIATDAAGNVYVADTPNGRIQKFDSNGNYLSQFSANGGQYLTVDVAGNIYSSASTGQVFKYSSTGQFLSTTSGSNSNTQLGTIVGLAADHNGNLFIADQTNKRISEWNAPIVPSAPLSVVANAPDTTSLDVSWQAPAHIGSEPLTGYKVLYRVHGTSNWITATTTSPSTLSYTINGLVAGTAYDVQIIALNAVGTSTDITAQAAQGMTTAITKAVAGTLADTGDNTWVIASVAVILLMIGGGLTVRVLRRKVLY